MNPPITFDELKAAHWQPKAFFRSGRKSKNFKCFERFTAVAGSSCLAGQIFDNRTASPLLERSNVEIVPEKGLKFPNPSHRVNPSYGPTAARCPDRIFGEVG
jgi:hypothetical protein